MKPQVVAPGHGPDYDWSQDHISVKTPMELTDGRVSVVEDVLKPGFHLPAHRHRSMVEIFYILEGEVTFAFEDETVNVPPGTTVTVPANTRHEVTCPGGGRLVTIFTPGGFERYLAELATLTPVQLDDAEFIRELGERYDDRVKGRIGGIYAHQKTRMGPAIRHATRRLAAADSNVKLMILLTDGEDQGSQLKINDAIEAAQKAISSPLLEAGAIDGARGILINITGSASLKLAEVQEACSIIQNAADEDANIIFGAVLDEKMKDAV